MEIYFCNLSQDYYFILQNGVAYTAYNCGRGFFQSAHLAKNIKTNYGGIHSQFEFVCKVED